MNASARTLLIPVILFGLSASVEAARLEQTVEQAFRVEHGETLKLRGSNGPVRITSWDRPEVKVEASKVAEHRRRSVAQAALDEMETVMQRVAGGVSIESRLPRRSRASTRIEYAVIVPSRFALDVQTSNGRLEVTKVEGRSRLRTSNGRLAIEAVGPDVEAVTSNGRIEATGAWGRVVLRSSNGRIVAEGLRGSAEIKTSNGRIRTTVREFGRNDSLVLISSNGSIQVELPAGVEADLEARTRNGSIASEFPVTAVIEGRIPRNLLRGTINGGGGRLEVRTSNGSIQLLRR